MHTATLVLRSILVMLALSAGFSVAAAPGRTLRAQALYALLLDLARIEISNIEREDPHVEQAIQQQINLARRQLLGAVEGTVPFVPALRAVQRHVQSISFYHERSHPRDQEVLLRLQRQIGQLQARIDQLLALATDWHTPSPPPGWSPPPNWAEPGWAPPPMPPAPMPPPRSSPLGAGLPMSEDRFAHLLHQVRSATFERAQLNLLRDAVRSGSWFTCRQIVAIMGLLSFDHTKVEAAALLYPRAVDPQNVADLLSALTFESHRQQLRQRLGY
ncbi:MAG: DUF4476 domain-containing protein [Myxococcales bacterium]|nr:DUF4476 domain-containing protein [Myxococcota bacterium]MDW8283864.1 DUF4476 domain-containing protein [Myxococcales bacterium]